MSIDSLALQLMSKFQHDREKLENYVAIACHSPLPAFIQARDGISMLYVNPAYTNLTGYVLADVQLERWAESVHPDDRATTLAWWKKLVAADRIGGSHIHRIIRKGGQATIKVTVVISCVENNGFVGFIIADPLSRESLYFQ